MKLTILSVAFPFAPVGPDEAGGAEQILASIDRALVARGHRSIVIAQKGSRIAGEACLIDACDPDDPAARGRVHAAFREAIEHASYEADVVHYHGLDFDAYCVPESETPSLATLHLPPSLYAEAALRSGVALVCVSSAQRRACPPWCTITSVVPNGVELDAFEPRYHAGEYAVALGRICEEKGFDLAIDAAERAGVPLVIAGKVFPYAAHERYFEERIRPRLGARCRFLGPIGRGARRRLLANARCLLVPSRIEETSSLVAMEALASGTPVVALDRGALGEVVEHGHTGWIVRDVDTMVEAIGAIDALDRRACRRVAEQRFDASRMHERYFALYRELAGRVRAA